MSAAIRDWDRAIAMYEAGKSDDAIADAMGMRVSALRERLTLALYARARNAKPVESRSCLRCSATFESSGPHNRICGCCKQSDDWCNPVLQHDNAIAGDTQRGARVGAA